MFNLIERKKKNLSKVNQADYRFKMSGINWVPSPIRIKAAFNSMQLVEYSGVENPGFLLLIKDSFEEVFNLSGTSLKLSIQLL